MLTSITAAIVMVHFSVPASDRHRTQSHAPLAGKTIAAQ
jgi:hypothetical protein